MARFAACVLDFRAVLLAGGLTMSGSGNPG
jgi:hypothetical protein